mmetsp:Transcript_55194/g.125495  ORF Transcript_55194/g.125495 Transcript_55194/m.125495 type:complete len:265 (-) Transcript_55194:1184-1978(-)
MASTMGSSKRGSMAWEVSTAAIKTATVPSPLPLDRCDASIGEPPPLSGSEVAPRGRPTRDSTRELSISQGGKDKSSDVCELCRAVPTASSGALADGPTALPSTGETMTHGLLRTWCIEAASRAVPCMFTVNTGRPSPLFLDAIPESAESLLSPSTKRFSRRRTTPPSHSSSRLTRRRARKASLRESCALGIPLLADGPSNDSVDAMQSTWPVAGGALRSWPSDRSCSLAIGTIALAARTPMWSTELAPKNSLISSLTIRIRAAP